MPLKKIRNWAKGGGVMVSVNISIGLLIEIIRRAMLYIQYSGIFTSKYLDDRIKECVAVYNKNYGTDHKTIEDIVDYAFNNISIKSGESDSKFNIPKDTILGLLRASYLYSMTRRIFSDNYIAGIELDLLKRLGHSGSFDDFLEQIAIEIIDFGDAPVLLEMF